ncbi:MAG: signal peptidase II [Patescibacteria group bacterium]
MNRLAKISHRHIAIALVIAIFFALDRILKVWALRSAELSPFNLIGNWLSFDFTANYYIAFSLPLSGPLLNWAVTGLTAGVIIAIIILAISKKSHALEIGCLILILLGAASNLFDRLIYGYVIDYLYLRYFTVFNLADAMISGGALLLILKSLKRS